MEEKSPNVSFKDESKEKIMHDLAGKGKSSPKGATMVFVFVVVLAGVLTGYFLSQGKSGITILKQTGGSSDKIGSNKVVGSTDTKIFKDNAEGKLEKGGIDGEGSHKLIRPGGKSQTVYLTSSVINLDDYVGKKVKVWGETFAAQTAGWLMDVGRLEILD